MTRMSLCKSAALVVAIAVAAFADSDTRTVQAEFDRCDAVMERFERSLRRYEDAIDIIKRSVVKLPAASRDAVSQEASALENRIEYFRNRYERSRGQGDKIRDELKNLKGPVCPSCTESSVNMYCRNGETMQNDIDEFLSKAADLQNRIGSEDGAGAADVREKNDTPGFGQRRSAIDSLYRSMPECADRAAATLRNQAAVNFTRADSLYARKDTVAAMKALDIATSLLDKAAKRCGEK